MPTTSSQTWYFEEVPLEEDDAGAAEPVPDILAPVDEAPPPPQEAACRAVSRAKSALTLSCKRIAGAFTAPSPRGGCSWSLVGRKLVLFGGADTARQQFAETYCFDLDTRSWDRIGTTGSAPSARSGHAAVAVGQNIYIHGGMDAAGDLTFDDMFRLDTASWTWSRIPCIGAPPRNSHSVVASPRSFCGTWSGEEGGQTTGQGASSRGGTSAGDDVYANSVDFDDDWVLLYFGGAAPEGPTNDVYVVGAAAAAAATEATPLRWTKVFCAGTAPAPREMHAACRFTVIAEPPEPVLPAMGTSNLLGGGTADGGGGVTTSMLVTGGRTVEGVVCNDLHVLDVRQWRWDRAADAPVPRCAHTATLLKGEHGAALVCVFGGWDGGATISDDAHVFDIRAERWMTAAVKPDATARFGHCAAGCSGAIFVFGGVNPSQELTDVEVLSLA
ncbi:unnamed protein product [Phaeothamnion confervicola]